MHACVCACVHVLRVCVCVCVLCVHACACVHVCVCVCALRTVLCTPKNINGVTAVGVKTRASIEQNEGRRRVVHAVSIHYRHCMHNY